MEKVRRQAPAPLASRMRPKTFDDIAGQAELVGENGYIRMVADGRLPPQSMILYGPPGCGKTTTALLLASALDMKPKQLNATTCSVDDIRKALAEPPVLLFLDEIHLIDKRRQGVLLDSVETGNCLLIGSTTENPYRKINNALRSRCTLCEFEPVDVASTSKRLMQVLHELGRDQDLAADAAQGIITIAQGCAGDLRWALNELEYVCARYPRGTMLDASRIATRVARNVATDTYHQCVAALQKSVRGSDPDAACFWLARLLLEGDLETTARRIEVMSAEDIGLACPDATVHTEACVNAALNVGMPEAGIILTEAVLFLALAPKSASSSQAWSAASTDAKAGLGGIVPEHLNRAHPKGYVWPQDKPYHWWPQQYLPDDLDEKKRRLGVEHIYYEPSDSVIEQNLEDYWRRVHEAYEDYTRKQAEYAHSAF